MQPFEKELQRIARFLNEGGDQAGKLWDVLSALRGPDDEKTRVRGTKFATTAVIRYTMGLKRDAGIPAVICPDKYQWADLRTIHLTDHFGDHFMKHAYKAFEALGLDWKACDFEEMQIDTRPPWYACLIGWWR